MSMINRLFAMIYKEFIYLIRDKKMRIIIIAVPLIQSIILGYAVNMDLKYVKTAVVNMDDSSESRALLNKFFSGGVFKLHSDTDMRDAEEQMLHGEISMIINIPGDFDKNLANGQMAPVQIILDATNSVNAGMAAGYVNNVIGLFNSEYASNHAPVQEPIGAVVKIRSWFNENFESRDFFVPSMLAMLLIIITVLLSGMAIVQEKESGTLEQLTVSPITAGEFIAGKSIPFAIVSFLDVLLIIFVAVFWFDIPLKGSVPLLLFSSVLYIFCTLGLGLLISAVSSTQQQAMMSTFMVIFPLILLSGFAFPIENMPESIQYLTYINPMRYYLVIIRGVFLKGLDIASLQTETLALAALGLAYLFGAIIFLKKKLG